MPEALILEFTDVDASAYAAVNAQLGIDMTTGPATGRPVCSPMPPAPPRTAPLW